MWRGVGVVRLERVLDGGGVVWCGDSMGVWDGLLFLVPVVGVVMAGGWFCCDTQPSSFVRSRNVICGGPKSEVWRQSRRVTFVWHCDAWEYIPPTCCRGSCLRSIQFD